MSWTGSTRDEPGRGAWTEGTGVRQRAHRSMASDHSGALKLTGGGATERGEHGELGSGLTGARAVVWRPDDAAARWWSGKLGGEEFWGGRGEERSSVRCGMLRGSSGWLL
jgi:hypothetical protein